ncbi:hypothetical protein FGO68_gene6902 [Halteria grandinella]|uniref:Uncharacterized protein n=1 Tax=Halteria grandinella TaxID=5974 RepID=A0A8J8SV80_HALGN|nr:hypothetical protein FGO68_gene6902 [Halteria grandinella]
MEILSFDVLVSNDHIQFIIILVAPHVKSNYPFLMMPIIQILCQSSLLLKESHHYTLRTLLAMQNQCFLTKIIFCQQEPCFNLILNCVFMLYNNDIQSNSYMGSICFQQMSVFEQKDAA